MQASRILPQDSPRILMSGTSKAVSALSSKNAGDGQQGDKSASADNAQASNMVSSTTRAGTKGAQKNARVGKEESTEGEPEVIKKKEKMSSGKKAACEGFRIVVYGKLG